MDARAKISDAIGCIEDMLELKSPRDFTLQYFPDDEITKKTRGGMLDLGNRVFYFGKNPKQRSFYHEAAHWVLMNNNLLFQGKEVFPIYDRALDETLAELCANLADGKIKDTIIRDLDTAKNLAFATLMQRVHFEAQAAMYMQSSEAKGRGNDPNVLYTAANLFYIPMITSIFAKAIELEEIFNNDRQNMDSAYAEFEALWVKDGNWIVEDGVAGHLGGRAAAILFEKGYHPKKIIAEIVRMECLSPMQKYWEIIVPKLED